MLQGLTTRSDDTEPALHTHVKWTVDAALQHVGFGRFQRRVLAAAILMTYTYGYLALLPVLLLPRLTSWRLSNADDAVVESAFFAGQFAGPIFGFISDRVGRRACARWLVVASFALGPAHCICTNIHELVALRALSGILSGGMVVTTFLLGMELCPVSRRSWVTTFGFAVGWTGATLVLVVVDWASADRAWQWLALGGLVPTPLALRRLSESPQYLLAKGRAAEALTVLREIGVANGEPLPVDAVLSPDDAPMAALPQPGRSQRSGLRCWSGRRPCLAGARLRRIHQLLPALTLAGAAWLGSTGNYNGSVFWPVHLASERRLRAALGALLELPAYACVPCLTARLGPARCWALFLCLGAIAWALLTVMGVEHSFAAPLILLVRFAGTGATTVCYNACSDAFPTAARGLGLGLASVSGKCGAVLAPLLIHLAPSSTGATGVLAVLAGASTCCALGLSRRTPDASPAPSSGE